MKIVCGRIYAFALPLLAPLRTGHGIVERREGFVIELLDAAGNKGYGEALPLPSFGGETRAICEQALRAALACGTPDSTAPVAACAFESAQLDLEFRARGTSLAKGIATGPCAAAVDVNALVLGPDADAILREVERWAPRGFRTWKLKVGVAALEVDVARVRALRAAVGPDARIRLDANGVWTSSAALVSLAKFAESEIELVEQPIAPGNIAALAALRRASPVRIAADESVVGRDSLRALLAAEAVDAIALKLPVLGGATNALALARAAGKRGVEVYITSFLDSSLGIAGALHVACALGETDVAHGLATSSLLARDLARPLRIADGKMSLPEGSGLGVLPDTAELGAPIAEVRA